MPGAAARVGWGALGPREHRPFRWKPKLLLFWWFFEFMCSVWTYLMFLPLATEFWRTASALLS